MMPLRTAYSVLAALSRAARAVVDRAARVGVACGLAGVLGLIAAFTPALTDAQTSAPITVAKPVRSPAALTGTLFTTREQRERLDRVRSRGGVAEDDAEANTEPRRSVINGFVKRSDGRNTVWVDEIMKRDPRAEVAEQLEPNMVGGSAGGAMPRTALITVKSLAVVNSGAIKRRGDTTRSKSKVSHKKRSRASIGRISSFNTEARR